MENFSSNTDDDDDFPRDKKRSYGGVSHEARREVEVLRRQLASKDGAIAVLRPKQGREERLFAGDAEPAASLRESLLAEMCKQRQLCNDTEVRASRQAEEIKRLNLQVREKELELEGIRRQQDHTKDKEIQKLRLALVERERSEASRTVQCTSLAEEVDQLRGLLGTTVKMCQELLARLERKKPVGGDEEEEVALQQKAKELTDSHDRSGANTHICQLQEENRHLKERVAYVQQLNFQWQKYDTSREDYIRGLCQRVGSVSSGLLHQEISRLNDLVEEKMNECAALRRDLEEAGLQSRERIQTLEQQVIIYEEDFKSERADRERAQGQIQDLKEQMNRLRQQLHKQGSSKDNVEALPVCPVHISHRIAPRRHRDAVERTPRAKTEARRSGTATQTPYGS